MTKHSRMSGADKKALDVQKEMLELVGRSVAIQRRMEKVLSSIDRRLRTLDRIDRKVSGLVDDPDHVTMPSALKDAADMSRNLVSRTEDIEEHADKLLTGPVEVPGSFAEGGFEPGEELAKEIASGEHPTPMGLIGSGHMGAESLVRTRAALYEDSASMSDGTVAALRESVTGAKMALMGFERNPDPTEAAPDEDPEAGEVVS